MKKSKIIKILGIGLPLVLGLFLNFKKLDPLINGRYPCLEERHSVLLSHQEFSSRRTLKETELMRASNLLEQKQFLQESEAICQLSLRLPVRFIPASQRSPASVVSHLNRNCQEESFFELGADGARARQFLHPQIHALDFPLKKDLGCVKDQGNRNTGLAFAALGAVELEARMADMKVNLSEQHFYATAKLRWLPTEWSSPRYFGDALPGVLSFKQAIAERYQFQPGNSWRYNPSLKRTLTTYPTHFYTRSCDNFSGPCSNTNHQGRITSCPMGLLNDSYMWCRYQLPQTEGPGLSLNAVQGLKADHQGILTSQLILRQKPLLTTLMVSRSFLESKEMLIETKEQEEFFGAQQLLVVGYVSSAALPNELDARSSGYYVVKNSWGENWGWRGYGLVSEDYFKQYSSGFIQLSLSRSNLRATR